MVVKQWLQHYIHNNLCPEKPECRLSLKILTLSKLVSVPDYRDPAEKKASSTLCEHLQDQQGEQLCLSTVIKEKPKQIVDNTKAFPPTVYRFSWYGWTSAYL